jgi:hypothetical protein
MGRERAVAVTSSASADMQKLDCQANPGSRSRCNSPMRASRANRRAAQLRLSDATRPQALGQPRDRGTFSRAGGCGYSMGDQPEVAGAPPRSARGCELPCLTGCRRPGVPMGGIGSLQPVNKPGSSSFLLKEAAFRSQRRCENRFGGSAYLPA